MDRRILLPVACLLIVSMLSGQDAAPSAVPAAPGSEAVTQQPADRARQRNNAQQRNRNQARRAQATAATRPAAAAGNRANRGRAESLGQPKPGGDGPAGTRLTGESLYNVQPTVLPRGDGANWLAWVGYLPGAGDFLFVGIEQDGRMRDIVRLTEAPADLFRPVLVRSGETTMLLFTQTVARKGPQIFYSTLEGEKWSAPQILPGAAPHTFNPEAAALPDGRIAVVYQVFSDGGYAIGLRTYAAGKWSAETRIAEPGTTDDAPLDCWDPVAAWDSAGGRLLIVWTAFYPGDYDLCWRTWTDGQLGRTERITRIGYDLHPSAVAAPDGGVWVAWDNIQIAGHAGSGRTFIKHPRDESIDLGPRTPRLQCSVWAARWADGKWSTPATGGRVTGEREDVRHGGSPKLAFDAAGRLHIAYRTRHEPVSGRTLYFWDISTRILDGDRWTDPIRLADSDGPTEEAALAAAGDTMLVFFQRDYRRTKGGNDGVQVPKLANENLEKFFSHHCDYGDPKLRHGDIFVTRVPGQGAAPRATQALAVDPPVRKEYNTFEP